MHQEERDVDEGEEEEDEEEDEGKGEEEGEEDVQSATVCGAATDDTTAAATISTTRRSSRANGADNVEDRDRVRPLCPASSRTGKSGGSEQGAAGSLRDKLRHMSAQRADFDKPILDKVNYEPPPRQPACHTRTARAPVVTESALAPPPLPLFWCVLSTSIASWLAPPSSAECSMP